MPRYIVVNPEGTVNTTGLSLSMLDIYNTFQPRKFEKFNTIPEANQIGEQQIVLYRSISTNAARLYTIIDNTTYYMPVDIVGSAVTVYQLFLGTPTWKAADSDKLDGEDWASDSTITGVKTFSATTVFSSVTISGNVDTPANSSVYAYSGVANQGIPVTTVTKVIFTNVSWDNQNEFTLTGASSSTFVAKTAGMYQVSGSALLISAAAGTPFDIYIYKNNSTYAQFSFNNAVICNISAIIPATLIKMNVGDYFDIRLYHNGSTIQSLLKGLPYTFINIIKVQ